MEAEFRNNDDASSNHAVSATNDKNYQYKPLDPDKKEIRLVVLEGRSLFPNLHISICTTPLTQPVEFGALSYCWGIPGATRRIPCDHEDQIPDLQPNSNNFDMRNTSTSFKVSDTLYEFLEKLRPDERSRLLWIDAICINQNDVEEKSSQVPMMGLIYETATTVIIWIPPLPGGTRDIDTVKSAVNILVGFQNEVNMLDELEPEERQRFINEGQLEKRVREIGLEERHFRALSTFFQSPWFFRLWTFQEAVLAKEQVYQCGNIQFLGWDLPITHQVLIDIGRNSLWVKSFSFHNVTAHRILRQLALQGLPDSYSEDELKDYQCYVDSLSFYAVVHSNRDRDATNPRDKIYGVLGVIIKPPPIQVDYSLSVQEIYISAAQHFMNAPRRTFPMQFLGDSGILEEGFSPWQESKAVIAGEHWPSWLPDWSIRKEPADFSINMEPGRSPSGGRNCDSEILRDHCYNSSRSLGPCLRVRGFTVLTIFKILNDLSDEDFVEHIRALVACHQKYPNDDICYHTALYDLLWKDEDYLKHRFPHDHYQSDRTEFWTYVSEGKSRLENVFPPEKDLKLEELRPDEPAFSFPGSSSVRSNKIASPVSELEPPRLFNYETDPLMLKEYLETHCKLFVSNLGFLGQIPKGAQVGDKIAVLFGAQTPFVVRQDGDHFLVVGACYVLGLGEGQSLINLDESIVTDLYFR